MVREIGFVIAGYGLAASLHAEALTRVEGARLVGVSGRNMQRAAEFARKYDVPSGLLEDILRREDVDVVDICTPTGTHFELVKLAAQAGKHVMVEKPLERDLEQTDKLIKVCEGAGVILGAVFQHRFDEAAMRVKEIQNKGIMGRPILGSAYIKWYRGDEYYEKAPWRKVVEESGGGALAIQGSHTLDLLLWFFGKPKTIFGFAETMAHDIQVEDLAVAVVKFESGALGTIEASTATYPGFSERLELHFEKGTAIIEGDRLAYLKTKGDIIPEIIESKGDATGAQDPAGVGTASITRMIQNFVDAVCERKPLLIDGKEGRRAVEFIDAVKRTARECKPVFL